jgi:hypothetical protein
MTALCNNSRGCFNIFFHFYLLLACLALTAARVAYFKKRFRGHRGFLKE